MRTAIFISFGILMLGLPAQAVNRHWNVGTGLWTTPGNWSPSGVPQPADNVFVDFFGAGSGGFARLNTSPVNAVTSLGIRNSATLTISSALTSTGSLLVGTDVSVGVSSSHGALNITSNSPFIAFPGGMTVVNNLRLGVLSGVGSVNQNAGTVAFGNRLMIGDSNPPGSEFKAFGSYNQSGGVLRGPTMIIGSNGTSGVLNLSGQATVNVGSIHVAAGGTVNQTGGQINLTGDWLEISGTYNISGGNLGPSNINDTGADTLVHADARLNYSGGLVNLGVLDIGPESNGVNGGRVVLGAGGNKVLRVLHANTLDGAVLDLNDNSLAVHVWVSDNFYAAQLRRGYNGGSWTGDGITSSAAAAVAASGSPHRTALGFAGSVVRYSYVGDATLDGKVDIADLGRLASRWQSSGYWYNGDFNYDGLVNITDLGLLASNWQQGVAAAPGPSFADALASLGLPDASIPEPTAIAALACLALLRRRPHRP